MPGQDNYVYRGFVDSPHIQDRLRLYSQQSKIFQLIALRQVNPLSILTVISEKFGTVPANMITDWRFRYQEMDELFQEFTLSSASVRPVTGSLIDYILVPNNIAQGLLPVHRLSTSTTWTSRDLSGGATTTNVGVTFDAGIRQMPEILKILGIGEASSAYEGNAATPGFTWVKVQRAHPAATVTGQLVAIPAGTTYRIVNSVSKTNARPTPPVSATGTFLENVCQITRESYGIGEHQTQGGGITTLLLQNGAAQLDMNLELVQTRLMKTVEKSIILGRKYIAETGNESEYETGGMLEFIHPNNYINAGGLLNVGSVNNIVAQALDISGVRELWMFGGSTFTKNLAEAYESKRGFGNETSLSVRYGLKVHSIEGTGRDGIVYYVNAPVLSAIGMDSQALILNLTEYNYDEKNPYGAFQIAEKVPIKDEPEDAQSYERNSGFKGTWRELYTAYGLIRRLQKTHFLVHGVVS